MFNSFQYSGSNDELLKLITNHAKQKEIDNQVFEILKRFFEKELAKESRPLSRPERALLFQQVAKAILADVTIKIDDAK